MHRMLYSGKQPRVLRAIFARKLQRFRVDIGDLIIAITHLHQRQRFRDGTLGERDRRCS